MNVLITGVGSIGRKHIAAVKRVCPQARIYALRSSLHSPEVEDVTDIHSVDDLTGIHIDFAIVSTPTALHAATVDKLLPLKCALLIEKPLSGNLNEAIAITRATVNAGIKTYIGCNLRYLDCLKYIKDNLNRPGHRINEINAYCGSYLPEWRPGTDFRTVYSARPELGGGVHIDLIHELDYIYWMFGKPLKVSRTIRAASSLGIEAPDYACYCLTYPEFCASVILNYYRRDTKRTLEIVWDDDTIIADLRANTVTSGLTGDTLFKSDNGIADTMADQIRYMTHLANSPSAVSANTCADAVEVLKICLGQ